MISGVYPGAARIKYPPWWNGAGRLPGGFGGGPRSEHLAGASARVSRKSHVPPGGAVTREEAGAPPPLITAAAGCPAKSRRA